MTAGALMTRFEFIEKYQTLLAKRLRAREMEKARGDLPRLQHIESLTDADLVRKWMWILSIVGGPICFIIVPFVLSLLSALIPHVLMNVLWNLARLAMAVIFAIFILAVYSTVSQRHH
jgi:hypothetical protein